MFILVLRSTCHNYRAYRKLYKTLHTRKPYTTTNNFHNTFSKLYNDTLYNTSEILERLLHSFTQRYMFYKEIQIYTQLSTTLKQNKTLQNSNNFFLQNSTQKNLTTQIHTFTQQLYTIYNTRTNSTQVYTQNNYTQLCKHTNKCSTQLYTTSKKHYTTLLQILHKQQASI